MRILASLLLVCVVLAAAALGHGAGGTLDARELKRGMKGYGLTVFRGTQPERFGVEVLDVLHNFRPDQDLILIRTEHPVLDQALVVGGMSGSPVYVEGKLIGAYAYGWIFGKEPVAGVTPIKNMLAELARPIDPAVWKALGTLPELASCRADACRRQGLRPQTRLAGLPPYLGTERSDALAPLRQHAAARGYDAQPHDGGSPRPAATPIMLGGFEEQTAALLHAELERFGLPGLQTGGGQQPAPATGAAKFVDGGSIGVQLIRGDISATAIGTVTHVAGQRLIGFGHPMMNSGQPALPTCTARVLHVLASQNRSFKIAEATTPLGTLVHDRQAAIVVDSTLRADTIPVRIRVDGATGAPRTEWNVEIASHRLLTPMLTFVSMMNALNVTRSDQSDAIFDVRSRLEVEGHRPLELRDRGYTPLGAASPMALSQLRIFDAIGAAYGNPFEEARIGRIDVQMALRYERDLVTLLSALVPSTEVDPGRDVNVYLTVQPFGEPEQTRIVPVHVPQGAAGEKIEVVFEPGNQVQLERPEPRSLDQIFDNVRTSYPSTSLVVSVRLPGQGMRLRGHVVRNLPGSAYDTLQLSGESGRAGTFATFTRTELPGDQVLLGSARVNLEVRREALR